MNNNHPRRSDPRESGVMQRVRKLLRELPCQQPHILLACSGGKDSVALAGILSELRRLDLIHLSIAHIHHGQHVFADTAAIAVQAIGEKLQAPVLVTRLDPNQLVAHGGVGLEEAMRRERYLALATIASNIGADCIAVAHHQTDQAETILLHLLRGSGVDGLAGMRVWEHRTIPWWELGTPTTQIGIWRPLLDESAKDVAQIAKFSGLPIVEDPTNTNTAYRRNAIRHELLPVIERISPGSTASVARAAALIAADADLLEQLSADHVSLILRDGALDRDKLVALPLALQRRVVRIWLLNSSPNAELSFERVTAVLNLAERNRGGAQVELGETRSVSLRDGRLTIDPWQNTGR